MVPALGVQDPAEIRAALDNRVEEAQRAAGLVVGTLGPQGRAVYAAGKLRVDGTAAPDENSVFEIGSFTKIFTCLLLADMIERGEVKADDPVSKYFPETVKVPRFETREITLLDLAMHVSGLLREPPLSPADKEDPYADYTEQKLYEFLNGYKLPRAPGEKYEYSNLGMGMLGHALARRAGKPYEEVLRERVLLPLGLTSTGIRLSSERRQRLAVGHNRALDPVKNWGMDVLAGAGGMHSTVADMLRCLAAAMGATETPLAPAFRRMLAGTRPAYAKDIETAMGWVVDNSRGTRIIWHNGGTAGYHSFAGYDPAAKSAVVVLCNTALNIDDIGLHILNARYPSPKLPPPRKVIALDENTLDRYTGRYTGSYPSGKEGVLVVTREGTVLYLKQDEQSRVRIFPEKENEFFLKITDAQITFVPDDSGKITHLVAHRNGRDFKAEKK